MQQHLDWAGDKVCQESSADLIGFGDHLSETLVECEKESNGDDGKGSRGLTQDTLSGLTP